MHCPKSVQEVSIHTEILFSNGDASIDQCVQVGIICGQHSLDYPYGLGKLKVYKSFSFLRFKNSKSENKLCLYWHKVNYGLIPV